MGGATTAGTHRHSHCLQRDREERSGDREQQQEPGSESLHGFPENQPLKALSLEHNWRSTQGMAHRIGSYFIVSFLPSGLRSAVNFRPPPTNSDKKKTPVAEEFRWLAFECVADELENPSDHEEGEGQGEDPETVIENPDDENGKRNQNGGNTKGVAHTIHRVLVATRVLLDPLLAGPISEHTFVSAILM